MLFQNKLSKIREFLVTQKIPAVCISSFPNRFWLSELSTSAAMILVTMNKTYFLTDKRYQKYAIENGANNFTSIIIVERNNFAYWKSILLLLQNEKITQLGFEGNNITVSQFEEMQSIFKSILELKNINISPIREKKSSEEIAAIRTGAIILAKSYDHITKWIKPGVTERNVKDELERYLSQNGGNETSFDTIVAFGKNTAAPHHKSGNNILQNNDIIMMDFGCKIHNYCSDMTRTFFIGKPDPKLIQLYKDVLEAQKYGVINAREGINTGYLTKIVYDRLRDKGYSDYIMHGLGHGLGIEIHEEPFLSDSTNNILSSGNVITIEPGVYIPDLGGVRIEDDLVIQTNYKKPEILTICPKKLHIIK